MLSCFVLGGLTFSVYAAANERELPEGTELNENGQTYPVYVAENGRELPEGIEVNENGQTYGQNKYDGFTPDLISAIGVDGVRGYVYDSDLISVGMKKSLDDVVTDIPTSIPLYASDGVTVIGEFPVGQRGQGSAIG